MKRYLLYCFWSGCCLSMLGQDDLVTACTSTRPNIINYIDMKKYVLNYHDLYKANTTKHEEHTKAYYINSKTILFLEEFFKKSSYVGLNIYLLTYDERRAKGQSRKKQNLPYLAPVQKVNFGSFTDTVADFGILKLYFDRLTSSTYSYDSLNKGIACKGNCDDSLLNWTEMRTTRTFTNKPGDRNSSDAFLFPDEIAGHKSKREKYKDRTIDEGEANGNQTKWVFLDTNTIFRLAYFIRQPGYIDRFPLIGIYYGSYNVPPPPERAHKDQTVFILVPLRKRDNNNFIPDPCSYVIFYNVKANNEKFAENHGTLCPTKCPGGGE